MIFQKKILSILILAYLDFVVIYKIYLIYVQRI